MIVGIDPGLSGGIAVLDKGKPVILAVMPSMAGLIQTREFARFFKEFDPANTKVIMELAQSFPKQGVASSFNYGRGFGNLEGALAAIGLSYTLVRPHVWTKEIHMGIQKELPPKQKSLIAVDRLFPGTDLKASARCRIPHDGLVDALLIAEYGRRKLV